MITASEAHGLTQEIRKKETERRELKQREIIESIDWTHFEELIRKNLAQGEVVIEPDELLNVRKIRCVKYSDSLEYVNAIRYKLECLGYYTSISYDENGHAMRIMWSFD